MRYFLDRFKFRYNVVLSVRFSYQPVLVKVTYPVKYMIHRNFDASTGKTRKIVKKRVRLSHETNLVLIVPTIK